MTYYGQNDKYRYYGHSNSGTKLGCKVQRVSADEVESVVLKYLKQSLADAGYFTRLQKRIGESSKKSLSGDTGEVARVKSELREFEQEATNIFRLQAQGSFGLEALRLMSDRLEDIAKKKSALTAYLREVEHRVEECVDASQAASYIQEKFVDFENGFRKSTPAQKKRLIRKTIKHIALTKENLALWFYMSDEDEIPGRKLKLVRDEASASGLALASVGSSNLSVGCLVNDGNGDRGPIEFELNTVVREYRISWEKTLADLSELAKLRWGRKWTEARIAGHLEVSFDSVHMRLRGLMDRNGCYGQLSPAVKKLVPPR
jgi:hypothetical protein